MITEGSLQDFGLSDLLQILAIGNVTGTLTLRSEGRQGQLYFKDGQLLGARLGDRWGKQAACDLFLWQTGVFDLATALPESIPDQETLSLEAIARDGLKQLERYRQLLKQLPEFFSPRTWVYPMQMFQEQKPLLVEQLGSGMTFADLVRALPQGELFTLEDVQRLYSEDQIGLSCAPEEQLRQLFERAANALFAQFASISGVKMVESLEHQLNEEARRAHLGLRWRQGHVHDSLPDTWTKDQLLSAYQPLMACMQEYIGKVYGAAFIDRVIEPLLEEMPAPQRALWSELKSLPTAT